MQIFVIHFTDLWQLSVQNEHGQQDNNGRPVLHCERGEILLINNSLHRIPVLKGIYGLVVVVLGSMPGLTVMVFSAYGQFLK